MCSVLSSRVQVFCSRMRTSLLVRILTCSIHVTGCLAVPCGATWLWSIDSHFLALQMLLGDNAYPNSRHLLTVYKEVQDLPAVERRRRKRFNRVLARGRIVVEQTIGSLKMRFPYLLDRLRCRREFASKVIVVCAALHNFLLSTGAGCWDVPLAALD